LQNAELDAHGAGSDMTESLLCDQQGTDDDRHLLQGFGDSAGNFDLLVKLSTKKHRG